MKNFLMTTILDNANMESFEQLEKKISAIERRNERVEADKAWETSTFRILSITAMTYVIASIVMWQIDVPRPYLNALIPTIGFYLSTQSLPAIKHWWISKQHK